VDPRPDRTHDGPGAEREAAMRLSTKILAAGALVFVLPVPGTFVLGALILLAGIAARVFDL